MSSNNKEALINKYLEQELLRERKLFNDWYTALMVMVKDPLQRTVIRAIKDELYQQWLVVKPYRREDELQ